MALTLVNLDSRTRQSMIRELDMDVANGTLYMSRRLSQQGEKDYEALLRRALTTGDDVSLAKDLRSGSRMRAKESKRTSTGGSTMARVPVTAPDTLAEGEFNRFYVRGLCARALDDGIKQVIVYRAKQVKNPRAESEAMIGNRLDAEALLQDLQTHPGADPALHLPGGPNSGLSVKLP